MAEALEVVRFLHFAVLMLLFGASLFCAGLAPDRLGASLRPAFFAPEVASAIVVVLTTLAWLGLETGEIGNGWSDVANSSTIGDVLTGTDFGMAWIVRLVLMLLPLLACLLRGRARDAALAVSAALLLASLGFVGHAADQKELVGLAHRLNQVLHLLSGGFWLGCLPPLLATLALSRRPELRAEAGVALQRFSGFGHVAVALVVLTGIVNTVFVVGRLPLDFSSPYQLLLVIKIVLVAAMIGIALFNRYVAVPRLGSGPEALRAITRGTIAELVLGLGVVALVSVFATLDPMPMDMPMG